MNAKECAAYHRGFRAGQKDERENIATTIALLGLDMEIARELATAVQNERAIREAPKRVSHDEHVRLAALAGVMPWASRWEMATAARDRIDALIARLMPERAPGAVAPRRLAQLCALRDRLNIAGGWLRANQPGCAVLDRSEEWDRKRIRVRNKINARLRAVEGA